MELTNLKIIYEFTNNERTYGIYEVEINSQKQFIIRNCDSLGVVQFIVGGDATKSVMNMTDKAKNIFLELLDVQKKKDVVVTIYTD